MTINPNSNLTVFFDVDLPKMASHEPQATCGFSVYRDTLIVWDEDHDERVVTFIDQLPEYVRAQLLVVQEHEGCLALLWRYCVPPGYEEQQGVDVAGDHWSIISSRGPRSPNA